MENPCISYKKGYRYQLAADYSHQCGFKGMNRTIKTQFVDIDSDGTMIVRAGFAWDGPSGPAIDTKNFMRGSLVHDALYGLMRQSLLDFGFYRELADRELQSICLEDGMSKIRAWWVYWGLRFGGRPAADPSHKKEILEAP